MENFNFCVGTRILFGKGQEEQAAGAFTAHMERRYC